MGEASWPDTVAQHQARDVPSFRSGALTWSRKVLGCGRNHRHYIVNMPGRGCGFIATLLSDWGTDRWLDDAQGHPVSKPAVGALLEPSMGAAIEWLRRHRAGLGPLRPDIAKHRLATLKSLALPASGTVATRRHLEDGFGEKRIDRAVAANESSLFLDARGMPQAENSLSPGLEAPWRAEMASRPTAKVTYDGAAAIDGVHLLYREAGPPGGPVVLLLHGRSASSHMFRHLIPALLGRYRVIAPGYSSFGQSVAPNHTQRTYLRVCRACPAMNIQTQGREWQASRVRSANGGTT